MSSFYQTIPIFIWYPQSIDFQFQEEEEVFGMKILFIIRLLHSISSDGGVGEKERPVRHRVPLQLF